MIQLICIVLVSFISKAATVPTGVVDVGSSALSNPSQGDQPSLSSPNGTFIFDNETIGDYMANGQWDGDECKWVMKYIPFVSSECTEYCEADTYNWGFQYHRLRYHIKLSGNGQKPDLWCLLFNLRMKTNCARGQPDFFECNVGRAQEYDGLRTWAVDGDTGKVVQRSGINIRFDFSPDWESRDAEHDCVRTAIREATCAGTVFTNGLRCIPTLYTAPSNAVSKKESLFKRQTTSNYVNHSQPEFDESYVPPASRCMYNSEVPPEAT
ncbi:hypothetical protein GGR54DRAFT_630985 [Hypoxylon sp. NC1633]|nr:hypothetical protein GGR54DRAFT_630985 [Hypoxylon sp. NC1633]